MRRRLTPAEAETIALNVLGFLADTPNGLNRLMEQSGLDSTTIRGRVGDRHFLGAVLDFLMANEELLADFCRGTQTEPLAVRMANHLLSDR
jgi:hypothetical protein